MADVTNAETMQAAALKYAALGFAVFPLMANTKQPRKDTALGFEHGYKNATRDPERITAAWTKYPADNIGIACGALSGNLIGIDIDNHNAEHNGFDTLTAWEYARGHMPETATAATGNGGMHLLYFTDTEISKVPGCRDCGIDVQAAGCYIIAAPSIHPNGTRYEWVLPPDIIPVANADARVMMFIEYVRQFVHPAAPAESRQSARRMVHGERYRGRYESAYTPPTHVCEGGRNVEVFKYASSLWAQGYDAEDVSSMTHQFNMTVCDPPVPSNEVDGIVRSVTRYPKGHSASWDATHKAPAHKTPTRTHAADKIERRLKRRG